MGLAVFAWGMAPAAVALRGLSDRRVAVLAWPDGADQVLVATHLADAWALGEAAFASGDPMAVVVAPRLSTFAGAPLGDRWARVTPSCRSWIRQRPGWTWPGMKPVYLAVRRDLAGPRAEGPQGAGRHQARAAGGRRAGAVLGRPGVRQPGGRPGRTPFAC
jgi:hypothetical protein